MKSCHGSIFAESDLLPLSGIQHLVFCERQCALIHLEQAWQENVLTSEGRVLHERTDAGQGESRRDVKIARAVPLRSLRLGLVGRADVVEFHCDNAGGIMLPGVEGRWRPYPVEYKRGQPKWVDCDRVQLCAQALCLEEMLSIEICQGALFYGKIRRREEISFDATLRQLTESAARRFHDIMNLGETPVVYRAPKCRNCSLLEVCLPPRRSKKSVKHYFKSMVADSVDENPSQFSLCDNPG